MKQAIKYFLIILTSLLVVSVQSMAQSKWTPIMMGDITTFVPYGQPSVKVLKDYYALNENVTVNVQGELSGDRDWVGIYPKGTNNDWNNVIKWANVQHTGNVVINSTEYTVNHPMLAGEYEARLFFHNNYVMKASDSFVVRKAPISTVKETYNVNETVSVDVQMALSGNEDWVGIYRKNDDNSWGNVIKWAWVTNNGIVELDKTDYVSNSDMPAGEYEVRLFFNNSYDDEATYGFTVSGGGNNNYEYGSGVVSNEIDNIVGYEDETNHPDYFVYYPKNNIAGAPLVLVSGYRNVHSYKGLMKYLASKGCYVVGHATRQDNQDWTSPSWRIEDFETAVTHAKNLGVDTSRLITMGSSAGGMVSYPIMKHFHEQGLGATKSFTIDIIGYYASRMTKSDLSELESDSLILNIGTDDGVQDEAFDQDPRVLLTVSKLLNNNKKKSYIALAQTNHSYAAGTYDSVIAKKDLLEPIDAMLKYEFYNVGGQYNNAEAILFANYDETVQRIYNATMQKVGNKEPLQIGYDYPCVNPWKPDGTRYDPDVNGFGRPFEPTIDYCNDHGLQ